jgi:hypothetical protein
MVVAPEVHQMAAVAAAPQLVLWVQEVTAARVVLVLVAAEAADQVLLQLIRQRLLGPPVVTAEMVRLAAPPQQRVVQVAQEVMEAAEAAVHTREVRTSTAVQAVWVMIGIVRMVRAAEAAVVGKQVLPVLLAIMAAAAEAAVRMFRLEQAVREQRESLLLRTIPHPLIQTILFLLRDAKRMYRHLQQTEHGFVQTAAQ